MSNPLYALASLARQAAQSGPASQPVEGVEDVSPLLMGIAALGTVMLIVWIIRRIAVPSKLDLESHTSPRPSTLTPVHLLIPFVLWVWVSWVGGQAWPELPWSLVAGAASQVIMLSASLAVAQRAFRGGLRRGLGLSGRHWLFDTGRALMGYLIAMPLVLAVLAASRALIPSDLQRQHVLLEILPSLSIEWKLLIVFSAVVLAPLSEEVFFRGLLQTTFRRYTGRPWVAIALASVTFGAVHLPYVQDIPALVVLAGVLGYNYERTGRLLTPILIHALFNAVMIYDALRAF